MESNPVTTRFEKILAFTSLVLGCVSFLTLVELGILTLRNFDITWIDAAYFFFLRAIISLGIASLSGLLSIVTGAISLARIRENNIDTKNNDGKTVYLASIWGIRLSLTGLILVLLFFVLSFLVTFFDFLN